MFNTDDIERFLKNLFNNKSDGFSLSYEFGTGMDKPIIRVNGKEMDGLDLYNPPSSFPFLKSDDGFRKPLIDQTIEDEMLKIFIELPGVTKKDIQLHYIEGNKLELNAKRDEDQTFKTTIDLITEIEYNHPSKAHFNNGILELAFPIKKELKKQISID